MYTIQSYKRYRNSILKCSTEHLCHWTNCFLNIRNKANFLCTKEAVSLGMQHGLTWWICRLYLLHSISCCTFTFKRVCVKVSFQSVWSNSFLLTHEGIVVFSESYDTIFLFLFFPTNGHTSFYINMKPPFLGIRILPYDPGKYRLYYGCTYLILYKFHVFSAIEFLDCKVENTPLHFSKPWFFFITSVCYW